MFSEDEGQVAGEKKKHGRWGTGDSKDCWEMAWRERAGKTGALGCLPPPPILTLQPRLAAQDRKAAEPRACPLHPSKEPECSAQSEPSVPAAFLPSAPPGSLPTHLCPIALPGLLGCPPCPSGWQLQEQLARTVYGELTE